jgi:hypothetical protein
MDLPLRDVETGFQNKKFLKPSGGEMNRQQIERAIQSIGKGCFVKYFEDFRDFSKSNTDLVDLLMQSENYTETASNTRVTNSRNIIKSGHAHEVLLEISKSNRLDYATITKAKELLRKYPSS